MECLITKGKGCLYSIIERRVPELIPVLGSQPAGDVSHKPDGRLPLLSARPVVIPKPLSGLLVQNSSKTTKKFFTFDVSTSIRGLHQKKLVLGLLLPVLGAIS